MQVSFAFLTGIALAAWWAVFVTIVIKTRPPRIDAPAAPATLAMIEPPAVAALLCSAKGVVPAGAASATFLDLVARGTFRFERDPHGGIRVVGGPSDSTLRRYERLVYDHVVQCLRKTPSQAAEDLLQLERRLQSQMDTFRDDVLADARCRGLVRDRTPCILRVVLWLALMVPAVFGLGALAQAQVNPPIFADVAVVLIGYRIATRPVRVLRAAVPTPDGARLAAAYRILRGHLAETADAHPPGDRLAAYSEALGAASADRAIWSTTSGHWRRVRIVNSPSPINWLLTPFCTLCLAGMLSALLAAVMGVGSIALISYGVAIFSVLGMQLGLGLLWIYEKVSREAIVVTGRVVYLGEESLDESDIDVALDDGRSAQAEVYKVGRDLFRRLHYGDWLNLELSPVLREIKVAGIVGSERH